MNKNSLDKAQDLLEKAKLSSESVAWWEKQITQIIQKLDLIEDSPDPKDQKKAFELIKELEVLLPRGQLEKNTINKLEKELWDFLKNEKKFKKNAKKSSRK